LVVLIEDVTAQLEYEETLEERFRLMQEGVKDYAMVILDDQGRITHWDRGAERLLMYQAPQIISRKISFFYASADQKQDQADLHLAVAFKTGRWEGEIPLQRKDGSTFWAELVLSVLKDQRERVRGFSLMIRDLTEQQEAKRALWDSLTQRKALEKEREKTLEQMRQTLIGTVQVISRTVEMRDPYTAGHQQRVAVLAEAIAREMRVEDDQREAVRMAGSIHDLGKISIPAEILVKPSRLTPLEYQLIQSHPRIGYDILKDIEFPWPLAEIVLQHHERMDGSGYPQGLKGEAVRLEARILAVADVVEAMASHRPYRPALGIEAALEEIEKNQGLLYDPGVAEACLRLFRQKGFRLG